MTNLLDNLTAADYALIGKTLATAGQHEKALAWLDHAAPEDVDALINRALPLLSLKRYTEAKAALQQALQRQPQNANAWMNMGATCFHQGEFAAARQAFETGQAIDSPIQHKFWSNLGANSLYQGDFERAVLEFRCAVRDDPAEGMPQMSLGMLLMARGEWAEGMRWYEGRTLYTNPFPFPEKTIPIWRGPDAPPGPRLLVVGEQGLGDCLMFARYAGPLKAALPGLHLSLWVDASLVAVLGRWPHWDAVLSKGEQIIPRIDAQVGLASLPYRLLQLGREDFIVGPVELTQARIT